MLAWYENLWTASCPGMPGDALEGRGPPVTRDLQWPFLVMLHLHHPLSLFAANPASRALARIYRRPTVKQQFLRTSTEEVTRLHCGFSGQCSGIPLLRMHILLLIQLLPPIQQLP